MYFGIASACNNSSRVSTVTCPEKHTFEPPRRAPRRVTASSYCSSPRVTTGRHAGLSSGRTRRIRVVCRRFARCRDADRGFHVINLLSRWCPRGNVCTYVEGTEHNAARYDYVRTRARFRRVSMPFTDIRDNGGYVRDGPQCGCLNRGLSLSRGSV